MIPTKALSLKKGGFSVTGFVRFWLFLGLFFIVACSEPSNPVTDLQTFNIKYPSVDEQYFCEKGDFYVIGMFSEGTFYPGNIRIEVFRGKTAFGIPVRTLESHVDPLTGVTPDSAIEKDYPEGFIVGSMTKSPDLIKAPGGFRFPGNKVLVTKEYFGAIILGGSSKDFDTDYTDARGNPLEDLTEGVYTVRVTGLSGQVASHTETIRVYFQPIRKLFGGFNPAKHKDKFFAYAKKQGYAKFNDPLPGYFSPVSWSDSYMIQKRARLRNSHEVVNTVAGATYGTAANAQIGFILYNLKDQGTTSCLEIGKAIMAKVIDNPNTHFYYYDIGEPEITYVGRSMQEITIDGTITRLAHADRLVLTRAAIRAGGTGDGDNRYNVHDKTPTRLDLDLSDGIQLATDEEFSLFGVVTPIPAEASADPVHFMYYLIDNRIAKIHYRIRNHTGTVVAETTRDVTLYRQYYDVEPIVWYSSIYEFEHEFQPGLPAGLYSVELMALDQKGNQVVGSAETFTLELQ